MEERERNKKILFIVLGVIILVLLFFAINACSKKGGSDSGKISISEINLSDSNVTLTVGDSKKLSYTVIPSNSDEAVKWISSDSTIATVDNKGNVSALKTGTAIITAVSEEGSVSKYCVVKVASKIVDDTNPITVSLTEENVIVKVGTSKQLLYDIDPAGTKYIEILWESSNQIVATVNSDGLVTGNKTGTANVTLKLILADNSVITDTVLVTVSDKTSLYLINDISTIKLGEVIRVNAALTDTTTSLIDGKVTSTSEKTVAVTNVTTTNAYITFDVEGKKAGNATIKLSATTNDGVIINYDVPVIVEAFTDLFISGGDKEIAQNEIYVVGARLEPSISGSMETSCSSSSTKVATVESVSPTGEYNGACQITGVKAGTSTITINISGQKKTLKVTVSETETPEEPDPEEPDPEIILTGLEAVLSKTSYSVGETVGNLTVHAIYSDNTKKLLMGSEYTVATPFDSTSPGTKTINIVYQNNTAAVTYTVIATTGGTTGGDWGGYPGGGTGGYKPDNTPVTTTNTNSIDLVDANNNVIPVNGASNPYTDSKINIRVNASDTADANKTYKLVVYSCEEGDANYANKPCDKVKYTINSLTKEQLTGQAPISFNTEDVSDGKNILSFAVIDSSGNVMSFGEGNLRNNYGVLNISVDGSQTTEVEDEINIPNIYLTRYKYPNSSGWYSLKEANDGGIVVRLNGKIPANVTATRLQINNVTVSSSPTLPYLVGTYYKSTVIKATLYYKDSSGVEKSVSAGPMGLMVDDIPPSCDDVRLSDNGLGITVEATDKESGIASATISREFSTPGTNLRNETKVQLLDDTYGYSWVTTGAGTYQVVLADKAGNKSYCSTIEVPTVNCYSATVCGAGGNGVADCNICAAAGCKDPNASMYYRFVNYDNVYGDVIGEGVTEIEEINENYSSNTIWVLVNGANYQNYSSSLIPLVEGSKKTNSAMCTVSTASTIEGSKFASGEGLAHNCKLCGCSGGWKYIIGSENSYVPYEKSDSVPVISDSTKIVCAYIMPFEKIENGVCTNPLATEATKVCAAGADISYDRG